MSIIKKTIIAVALLGGFALATPAQAGEYWGRHHYHHWHHYGCYHPYVCYEPYVCYHHYGYWHDYGCRRHHRHCW